MSEHGVLPDLWPICGDGVLARQGDLVLLVHPAGGAFTDRLLDLLADTAQASESGLRFTDLVSAEFDADAAASGIATDGHDPAVVAFGPADRGIAVTVYGVGWAEVTTARGVRRLMTDEPYGRLRCVLPSKLIKIRAGVRAMADEGATDPYLRLADGIVRAAALVYAPGETEAETAGKGQRTAHAEENARREQPVPAPDDDRRDSSPSQNFIAMPLVGDEARGEVLQYDPLPVGAEPPDVKDPGIIEPPGAIVVGFYCKNGHFNDPKAGYCAVCGIGMGQLTRVPREGDRPPLGVLILADGSVCQLDTDYVLGREPMLDTSVTDGRARPLRLADGSGLVSRIHARVELDGWQVFISDLHSANGTQVLLPGESDGTIVEPGVRVPLIAGAQIYLGGEYGLRYDSHRHR